MDIEFEKAIIQRIFKKSFRERSVFLLDRDDRDRIFYLLDNKIRKDYLYPIKAKIADEMELYRMLKREGCDDKCYFMHEFAEKSGYFSLKTAAERIQWCYPAIIIDVELKTGFVECDGETKWQHFMLKVTEGR